MAVNRSPRGRTSAPRRKRIWARTFAQQTVGVAPPAVRFDLLGALQLALGGAVPFGTTVGRVKLTVGLARLTGTLPNAHVFMGLRVYDLLEEAEDGSPVSGLHQDWMFWRKTYLTGPGSSAAVPAALGENSWEFDIKAMRKMEEVGQGLAFYAEGDGTCSYLCSIGSSVLLVLP